MNFLDETCRGQVMGLIRARARTRETWAGIQPSGPDISSSEWGRRRGTKWEGGDRAMLFQGEDKLSKGGGVRNPMMAKLLQMTSGELSLERVQ